VAPILALHVAQTSNSFEFYDYSYLLQRVVFNLSAAKACALRWRFDHEGTACPAPLT